MSTSCPGRIRPVPVDLRYQPAVLGYLSSWLRLRRIDLMPRAPQARVRGPAVLTSIPGDSRSGLCAAESTRTPGRLGPVPEIPRGRPAVLGKSVPCPMARSFDQLFLGTRVRVGWPVVSTSCPGRHRPYSEGLRGQPAVPGDSRPCPSSRGVHLLSRTMCDQVRGLAGSTSCPV